MAPTFVLQPTRVATGSADEEGQLVLADGRLVAVLVRLADATHAGLVGSWFLEAGFGPCAASKAPTFASLEAAAGWVERQLAAAWTRRPGRAHLTVVKGKGKGSM